MFQVKVMSVKDYRFAVDLANTMGWGVEVDDFRFNQFLEPEGCLVLFDGLVPVGLATCVSFGKGGWFGNFVIRPDYRGQGGGRLLLEHAIGYLQGKGVESIGLYAYPYLEEFYSKFGFKADLELTVMHNTGLQINTNNNNNDNDDDGCVAVSKVEGCLDFSDLLRFDRRFFGVDRSQLLRNIIQERGNRCCYVAKKSKEIVGYGLAKDYGTMVEVGPLVCCPDKSKGTFKLLQKMLGELKDRSVVLYLLQDQKVLQEFLLGMGFSKEFSLSRMFLGVPPIQRGVYLAESLERG